MTRRTPEASFLYTQTPDRPPLAAVTRNRNQDDGDENAAHDGNYVAGSSDL